MKLEIIFVSGQVFVLDGSGTVIYEDACNHWSQYLPSDLEKLLVAKMQEAQK